MTPLTVTSVMHEDILFESYRRSPGPTERLPTHTHAEYQLSVGLTVQNAYEHRDGASYEPPGRLTILPPGLAHRPAGPTVNRREARLLLVYLPSWRMLDAARQMGHDGAAGFGRPMVLDGEAARALRGLHRDLRLDSVTLERDERLLSILVGEAAIELSRAPHRQAPSPL